MPPLSPVILAYIGPEVQPWAIVFLYIGPASVPSVRFYRWLARRRSWLLASSGIRSNA